MPLRAHEDICIFYKKTPAYNPQKTTGHVRKVSKATHYVNSKQTTDYGEAGFVDYDSTERYPRSVLKFAIDTQKGAFHPTQKPLQLCEYLIRTFSDVGDTVLDFCAGSGTTLLAAINTGRYYVGFEKEKEYYDIALKRLTSRSN